MRIDKFLSQLKYGSRKEVAKLIKDKKVYVNNHICCDNGIKIDPNYDTIIINGTKVFYKEEIHLAFYKPIGYLSANKDNCHQVLFDLIKEPYNRFDLKIAGRLDLDSEGLMILSTDGNFIHNITNPKKELLKVYQTILDKPFNDNDVRRLLDGVMINDGNNQPYLAIAKDCSYDENIVKITISEGKFHQVKRMFKALDYQVLNLKRIAIGKLKLDLEVGTYKEITKEDVLDDANITSSLQGS